MKNIKLILILPLMLLSWGTLWAQGPTVTSVFNLDGGCLINVTAPANNFGGVNAYQYSLDNGTTWTTPSPYVTSSPLIINGLTNCNTYSVKIRASQWYGTSAASSAVTVQPKPAVLNTSNDFVLQAAAISYSWNSVTYGNGLFVAVASSGQGNRVMTSPDGVTWTSQTTPSDQPWKTVAYGNGTFVALANGNSGAAMTSTDGITWTQQTVGNCEWESVTFGGGMFVAVASSGYPLAMYSSDGINWNQANAAGYESWKSVTYGGGKFVAVAEYGSTYSSMTSTDGINWTGNSAIQNDWKSVTYGAGKFVALCASGTNRVMTSLDGASWTSAASSVADNGEWTSVTYGNNVFVAVAQNFNNKIMWSLDGVSWYVKNEPANDNWQSVTFGNGSFVAVANYGSYQGQVMTNTMSFTSPPDAPVITVAASGATVYFTPPDNSGTSSISYYEYSTDNGTTWINPTPAITASPFTISGLTSGGVRLRAVSSVGNSCPSAVSQLAGPPGVPAIDSTDGINGGALVYFTAPASDGGASISNYEYSTDNGTTWVTPSPAVTSSPLAFTGALQNCTSGSVKIRAVNIAGTSASSSSASIAPVASQFTAGNFIRRGLSDGLSWKDVVFGNGIFVAVGGNGAVMTSSDGLNWTKRTAANNNNWSSVTYGNGLFVAVAESGTSGNRIMTSPDGIIWTARSAPQTSDWNSVEYGNGVFVAMAHGYNLGVNYKTAMVSSNGINWTLSTLSGENKFWRIMYGNGKFLALPSNATFIKSSSDGINWTSIPITTDGPLYISGGAYGQGKFILLTGGTISGIRFDNLYSSDGVNWIGGRFTSQSQTNPVSAQCITYGNGGFIVFPYTALSLTSNVYKSIDGISWTTLPPPTGGVTTPYSTENIKSLTYGNGRYVAVNDLPGAPSPVMTSNVISMATPPPVITSITPYHTSCFVNFTASSSPNSEPATNYQYSINNGTSWTTMNPAVTTSPFKISGLTNGTNYNIMIRSVSLGGNSCPSNTVSVTPVIGVLASAPAIDSIKNRDNSALVYFTSPSSDGGSPITNYQFSVDSGTTWITRSPASTTSPLTATGISNCSRYPIFIRAVNATGPGANSNLGVANPRNTLVDVPTSWTSTNGPTIIGTANGFNYWYDIAYGNGLYVVVGNQGGITDKVLTSSDGVNWTKRTAAANIYWNKIAFGNGIFVATSNDGNNGIKIMSSTDGISWVSRQSPFTNIDNIVFANGKFVAVGYSSQFASCIVCNSTDGITWTHVFSTSRRYTQLVYGKDKFIASDIASINGNDQGVMMTSPDGITWTIQNNSTIRDNGPIFITYGAGKFVAYALGYAGAGKLIYSTDGINWVPSTQFSNWISGIAFGNEMFISAGSGNTLYSSINGVNWTSNPVSTSTYTASLRFLNGKFFMLDDANFRYISPVTAVNTTSSAVLSFAEGGIFQVPNAPTINSITTSGGNGSIAFTAPASNGGQPITNYEYSIDNGNTWVTPSPEVTTSPLTMPGDTVGDILIRAVNRIGAGCPSATYSVLPCLTTTSSTSVSKCPNELPYIWNGIICNAAGDFTWTGVNAGGCDSIATLTLTVTNQSVTYDTVSVCASYTWPANNVTYTQSGNYSYSNSCLTNYLNLSVTTIPPTPTGLSCYETATLNTMSCQWEVTGTQPAQPTLACYETASFNTNTCSWDVTGTQPAHPTLACYQTASFNTTTCQWDVTGTQPVQPTLACYETAVFNTTTCSWDVTGTQPAQPTLACYETASFNTTICQWEVTGSAAAPIVTTESVCDSYTWAQDGQTYTASGTYSSSVNCQDYFLNLTVSTTVTYYADSDGDGYGSINISSSNCTGIAPSGYITTTGDCNDNNPSVKPDATELCNSIDDDCDGIVDDNPLPVVTGSLSGISLSCRARLAGNATFNLIGATPGATSVWSVPAGFTITSGQGTSSITLSYTASAIDTGITGPLCMNISDACGSSASVCTDIDYQIAAPVIPPSISGPSKPCPGDVATYSIARVARATSYTWSMPAGVTLLSGQGSNIVQVSFGAGFTGGNMNVIASNVCGNSNPRTRNVLNAGGPPTPTAIGGTKFGLCNSKGVVYTANAVSGATSYLWSVTGGGVIVSGQGTGSITVDFPSFTAGNITVQAANSCGASQQRTLYITGAPGKPEAITGAASVCRNATEVYSIPTVNGTSNNGYNWTVSSAGTISSGQGTKSILVLWHTVATAQALQVNASNACGTGPNSSRGNITVSSCSREDLSAAGMEMEVYPNPAQDRTHVVFNANSEDTYRLNLTDMSGRTILSETGTTATGRNEFDIYFGDVQAGVYFIEIRTGESYARMRIVIAD